VAYSAAATTDIVLCVMLFVPNMMSVLISMLFAQRFIFLVLLLFEKLFIFILILSFSN